MMATRNRLAAEIEVLKRLMGGRQSLVMERVPHQLFRQHAQIRMMMEVTKQYKRWDEADLTYLTGYYGDYLLRKMSKALQN